MVARPRQRNEKMVRGCQSCYTGANLQPWAWPPQPWKQCIWTLHDHLKAPCSCWQLMLTPSGRKIDEMSSITVAKTIEVLRGIFASYGLPEQIVTDNEPQFTTTDLLTS